jgi:hypothetical protein
MRLFSYVVTHDTGFAPNPFFGHCTLACCKPRIRMTAEPGDWIVGLTRKSLGSRIVYALCVEDEPLRFEDYWRDGRFRSKRPNRRTGRTIDKAGDNIYEPLGGGRFRQLPSTHSHGCSEDPNTKKRDLAGRFVLVGTKFVYFGSRPVELPDGLECLIVGRGHKCRFSQGTITAFEQWISRFTTGMHAPPTKWPQDDVSWERWRASL